MGHNNTKLKPRKSVDHPHIVVQGPQDDGIGNDNQNSISIPTNSNNNNNNNNNVNNSQPSNSISSNGSKSKLNINTKSSSKDIINNNNNDNYNNNLDDDFNLNDNTTNTKQKIPLSPHPTMLNGTANSNLDTNSPLIGTPSSRTGTVDNTDYSDYSPSSKSNIGNNASSIGNSLPLFRAVATNASTASNTKQYDLDDFIQRLLEARNHKVSKTVCLKNSEITSICVKAREILLSQPMLLELNPPVRIVGDVHGQYYDLIRIFDKCGYPPKTNYMFLGDYVDRGKQSLETILLLLCYKIKYPENFFILRGNHECASVNRVYGFYDECKRRTTLKIWRAFTDVFNVLPVAGLVGQKIFCVHGGLSPSLNTMDDIRRLPRPGDVPDFGLLNDLLWSDPSDQAQTWEDNERGVSYCFGKQIVNDFLARHDLDLVCRAHMVVEDGYEFFNSRRLVTIFSAPNYCGEFDNKAAVMSVNEDLLCSFDILEPMTHSRYAHKIKSGRISPPVV